MKLPTTSASLLLALLSASSPTDVVGAPPDRCCCQDGGGTCLGFKWRGCTSGGDTCATGRCSSETCNDSCQCVTGTTATTTTVATATTTTATTTEGPGTTTTVAPGCPTSLGVMCVGWVRGNSGKIHALVKVGGTFDVSSTMTPVDDATVFYETHVNGEFNTEVTTSTGDYVFAAYQNDYENACGSPIDGGVTESANCFETAPQGAYCTVTVTRIELEGCPGAMFESTDVAGSCVFAGRRASAPCQV